ESSQTRSRESRAGSNRVEGVDGANRSVDFTAHQDAISCSSADRQEARRETDWKRQAAGRFQPCATSAERFWCENDAKASRRAVRKNKTAGDRGVEADRDRIRFNAARCAG